MSRIGKKPILIPEGVEVKIEDQKVTIRGPKGELSKEIRPEVKVEEKEGKVFIILKEWAKKAKAPWGLFRNLIANMIEGVTEGYEKKLQIEGVGYRANVDGNKLVLSLGFSHPVEMQIPEGLQVLVEKNIITISGINKELVGQFSANIRKVRPPEPYKGKGIRYIDEVVRRKAGKKTVTTET